MNYPNLILLCTRYRGESWDLRAVGEVPEAGQFAAARLHFTTEPRASRLRVLVPQQPYGQLRQWPGHQRDVRAGRQVQ